MATSQQQWRRGSQLLLLALALVLLLAAGSANACSSPWADCDSNGSCETNVNTDAYNCGWCGNVCSPTYTYGVAYCSGGNCHTKCPDGWTYNSTTNTCVQG